MNAGAGMSRGAVIGSRDGSYGAPADGKPLRADRGYPGDPGDGHRRTGDRYRHGRSARQYAPGDAGQ